MDLNYFAATCANVENAVEVDVQSALLQCSDEAMVRVRRKATHLFNIFKGFSLHLRLSTPSTKKYPVALQTQKYFISLF